MIDRKALKARSKEWAFSHKMAFWKPFLYIFVVSLVIGFILGIVGATDNETLYSIVEFVLELAILPLSFAAIQCVMKAMHGETVDVIDLFKKKYKLFVPILVMSIVMGVIVGIGFVLLIIPGIILALRYSMASFMAAEAEESFDGIDSLKASAKMMDGHKWEYFVLQLSFIGWMILGSITLGIAYIWVLPYMTVTEINYYEELKKLQK